MHIVRTYGRNVEYNFDADPKLAKIAGIHSDHRINDKTKIMLSIDGFMTIWLLTLPEKFKDWAEYYGKIEALAVENKPVMSFGEAPLFPVFSSKKWDTFLAANPQSSSYEFLPPTWNLLNSFKYYLEQKELWTTKSIDT